MSWIDTIEPPWNMGQKRWCAFPRTSPRSIRKSATLLCGHFLEKQPDYASNAWQRTFPLGLDTEIMTFAALARAWREGTKPYERIHVTPYIYEHPDLFKVLHVKGGHDYGQYRWTLDTPEDLAFLRAVYDRLGNVDTFHWREVLALWIVNRHCSS